MDRNTKRTRYCRHHHATAVVNSRSQRNCCKVNCKVVRPAQFQADSRLAWVAANAPINQRKTRIRFQIEKHFVSMQLHDPVDTRTITGRTYGLPELVIISVQCLSFVILEVVPLLLWSGVLSRLLVLNWSTTGILAPSPASRLNYCDSALQSHRLDLKQGDLCTACLVLSSSIGGRVAALKLFIIFSRFFVVHATIGLCCAVLCRGILRYDKRQTWKFDWENYSELITPERR